jgi:hypothetical protein
MRRDGFLRTPIRADHQARLQNLTITEAALNGNPDPALPYPQTLEISFDVAASTTEVQVAMPWEGLVQFLPDSTLNHPAAPGDVTVARYPTWAVAGDLVLRTYVLFGSESGMKEAFSTHLPLVDPIPAIVRFSKVRLTQGFLFNTLGALPKNRFIFDGAAVTSDDPLHLQKLIIKFLAGDAFVPFKLDPADATKDHTMLAMPSVELAAAGTTTFRFAIASASENSLSTTWFVMRPEDAISGEPLVPAAIDNFKEQVTNPAHPHHSVIPARLIFQRAAAAAYAPDHGAATAVRAALAAALPGGRSYRRIGVIRPPLPGSEVSSVATRPYPMYRLCWTPVGGGATESLRLPLSGRVYLPLADGSYRFWVIPRSADPTAILAGDHMQLSGDAAPPARYIGLPSATYDVALGAGPSTRLYAHAHRYDSRLAWEGFRRVAPTRRRLKVAAARAWRLPEAEGDAHGVLDWFILPTSAAREDYRELYGYIRESAGRHGLAPEFLQVVFFGEGGGLAITGGFDPARSIDTWGFVGLDLILYRTGRLPIGAPPVPPEAMAAGDADEIAEFTFNLVTTGYVDPAIAAAVSPAGRTEVNEIGRTIHIGTVAGWKAAIELVAAELHARLDEMTAYLAAKVPPIAVVEENQRRFLAYLRYSSRPVTARGHADNLAVRLRPWSGALPPLMVPSAALSHFLAIQRAAVTQWHEAAAVYRSLD